MKLFEDFEVTYEDAPYKVVFKPINSEKKSDLEKIEKTFASIINDICECINEPFYTSEEQQKYFAILKNKIELLRKEENNSNNISILKADLVARFKFLKKIKNGYFIVDFVDDGKNNFKIKYEFAPSILKENIPDSVNELFNEIKKASFVINSLEEADESKNKNSKINNKLDSVNEINNLEKADESKNKNKNNKNIDFRRRNIKELNYIAELGLEYGQVEAAERHLELFKERIYLSEGQRIKRKYMEVYGILVFKISIIVTVLYFIINFVPIPISCSILNNLIAISPYLLVFGGAMVGTWLSFGGRSTNYDFDSLIAIEKDMVKPKVRLLYIGICAVSLFLLLNCGIITFEIANSQLVIPDEVPIQLAFGVICGLLESKIGIELYNKVHSLIKKH